MGIPNPPPYPVDPRRFAEWQEESRHLDRLTPIFVIGPNKCGTTWMYDTLEAHPAVAGLNPETHLMNHRLAPFLHSLEEFARPKFRAWKTQVWIELEEDESVMLLRQMADRVILAGIRRTREIDDPTLGAFVEKTPNHSHFIPVLARLYPNARFICCTRDVRDAVVSAWKHMGKLQGSMPAPTIEAFALNYLHTIYVPFLTAAREAGAALGPGRYTEVSYEARQANDAEVIAQTLRFLGLDASPRTVEACLGRSAFERKTEGRTRGIEAESFYRKGVSGDWVNHMSEEFGEALSAIASASLRPVFENTPTLPRHPVEKSIPVSCA